MNIMQSFFDGFEIIQYLAAFFGSLNIITSGLQYGWPSASLPQLQNPNDTSVNFHITASEGSWVAVAPLLGAVIGSPLAGSTVDIVGRKKMIVFTFFPYMTSYISLIIATGPGVLFFGRFMSGISDGCIFTSLPIYIGEIANPKVRGFLCSTIPICLISGVLLINVLGAFLNISTAALVCMVFPITSFLGMVFMPESPYYLLLKGKQEEARRALERIRNTENIKEELKRMQEGIKCQKEESKGKIKDIFTISSNRRALLVMMLLRAAQQLSGITALIFYISTILEESGAEFSVTVSTLIFFGVQLVMSIVGSIIVDWTGRRPLLLWSALGSALALAIEGLYFQAKTSEMEFVTNFNFIPIAALIVYVIFFGFGLQNIPLLMLGELFPTNIKAAAVCFGDLYFAALATLVSKFFQIVSTDYNIYIPFYYFSLSCVVCSVLIYFFVPETKGITLEEIQCLLKAGKRFKNGTFDVKSNRENYC